MPKLANHNEWQNLEIVFQLWELSSITIKNTWKSKQTTLLLPFVFSTLLSSVKMNDTITDPVTEESFLVIRTILYSLVAIIVIIGNIFVLLILPKVHMQSSIAKLYLYSLTIADLCTGLFLAFPMAITSALDRWVFGKVVCAAGSFGKLFLNVSALLSLFAVTIDRFLAIAYPLRYPILMTQKKAVGMVTLIWIMATFCGLLYGPILRRPPMYNSILAFCFFTHPNPNTIDFSILICFIVFVLFPFVATIILYSRLYCITIKHTKFISSFESRDNEQVINNLKFIKTFTLVIFCFGITWLPCAIIQFIEQLSNMVVSTQFLMISEILILSNSGINVFIYFWRNKEFKKAAVKNMESMVICKVTPVGDVSSNISKQTGSHVT